MADDIRRIMGIDPGTVSVGYGIIDSRGNAVRFVSGGCIRAKDDTIAGRLVTIHTGLKQVIAEYSPTQAAIETVFGGKNIKTSIAIGEGRGVAVLSAAEMGLEVFGYEPATVKRAVAGSGRASKEQIMEMVRVLLCLPEQSGTDHEADALALAITHASRQRFGIPGDTLKNRKAGRGRRKGTIGRR